jgi:hypothetical protein
MSEDFKRQKQVIFYKESQRVIILRFQGINKEFEHQDQIDQLKSLAEQLTSITSKYKIQEISLNLNLTQLSSDL